MGMRFTRVLILREQLLQNAALESFIFTCLMYKKSFQNGPVHEFYGLKASQMSKVCASSHEYPHAEKSRIFVNGISKVRQATSKWIVRILKEVTSVVNIPA